MAPGKFITRCIKADAFYFGSDLLNIGNRNIPTEAVIQNWRGVCAICFIFGANCLIHAKEMIPVSMKVIHLTLVLYPQKNEQAASHSQRKADDINGRECLMTNYIS